MSDTNQTKRGRGRPKGGTSFVNVTMSELQSIFGPQQSIPVSRVWLEKINVKVTDSQPVVQAQAQATTSPQIPITLED